MRISGRPGNLARSLTLSYPLTCDLEPLVIPSQRSDTPREVVSTTIAFQGPLVRPRVVQVPLGIVAENAGLFPILVLKAGAFSIDQNARIFAVLPVLAHPLTGVECFPRSARCAGRVFVSIAASPTFDVVLVTGRSMENDTPAAEASRGSERRTI